MALGGLVVGPGRGVVQTARDHQLMTMRSLEVDVIRAIEIPNSSISIHPNRYWGWPHPNVCFFLFCSNLI